MPPTYVPKKVWHPNVTVNKENVATTAVQGSAQKLDEVDNKAIGDVEWSVPKMTFSQVVRGERSKSVSMTNSYQVLHGNEKVWYEVKELFDGNIQGGDLFPLVVQ